jgi:acetyltransferase
MFYSFSASTVYRRFFQAVKAMPHEKLQRFTNIDYNQEVALVGVVIEDEHELMVAVARYIVDPATHTAEVAFVVRDAYQHMGIGTRLFRNLLAIARDRGIRRFIADVLPDNTGVIQLFHKCATGPVQSEFAEGVYRLSFEVR